MPKPPEGSPDYIERAWREGYLRYKLRPDAQRRIYDFIKAWKRANPGKFGPIVINSHRRLGKSYLSCVLAVERCLKRPRSFARLIAPTDEDCAAIHKPHLDEIFRDMPECVSYRTRDRDFIFRNEAWGDPKAHSILSLEGSEHKKGNRQRGKASDFVDLDEFRDMTEPDALIDDIIRYTFVKRTLPLLVITSTPPELESHPLRRRFIPQAMARGTYLCITGPEDKDMTAEDEELVLEDCPGGRDSISYRREWLCELISDPTNLVIPEFVELENIEKKTGQPHYSKVVVENYKRPPYYHPRVCIDFGYDDYTAAVYYYVDFKAQLLVVEDELWVHRQTSRELREMIQSKAREVFPNPSKAIVYEGDMPKQQRVDMAEMLKFCISPVDKTEKAVAISGLRDSVRRMRIRIVGPKCPRLIYQLRNGSISTTNPKDFARDPEDADLGHCDLLAALIYAHRRAMWGANPYPIEGFTVGTGQRSIFIPTEERPGEMEVIDTQEVYLQ